MKRNLDPLPFDSEIAAIPHDEFVSRFQQAYHDADREQFILLGQRLAWNVTCNTIRAQRIAPYRMDMYSVGLLTLIEQFDRKQGSALESPYGYFRRVVYYQILQFLYRQGVLIRKSAKQQRLLLFDTDVSGRDNDGWSLVGNAPARHSEPDLPLDEAIQLCLQVIADSCQNAMNKRLCKAKPRKTELKRRAPMTAEFDPTVTATPAQLRKQGYTWNAIGQLLGISMQAACTQPHKTPERLRQQKAIAERNRAIGRGELPRERAVSAGEIPRGPRTRPHGASLCFDPTVTTLPKELRGQGYTWKEIGQLLGISQQAARNAAHRFPHKTPEQLRQQRKIALRIQAKSRRQFAAA